MSPFVIQNSPPNGGWLAWRQVLASFFMSMCSLGLANAFGIFQSSFQDNLLSAYPPSTIAWIGTTQGFLVNVTGLLSGQIYDLGYVRPLVYVGLSLNVAGLLATSFATTYLSIFLSLGVCVGLGSGLFYVPSLAIVTAYFSTRLPLAAGISATGASIGGVVYPVLFRVLLDHAGLAWATRAFALLNFCLLLISCLLLQPRSISSARRRLFDPSAIRDTPFLLFSITLFLLWLGVDVPFFYLPSFVSENIGLSAQTGDYLLAGMNASSIFGRVLFGLGATLAGSIVVWQGAIAASCALLACWAVITTLPGIVVFVVLYGLLTGGVISLVSSALVVISPDLNVVGTRLGMSGVLAGIGFLIGPPVAGAIQKTAGGYAGDAAFAASTYLAAFGMMGLASWSHRRRRLAPVAEPSDSTSLEAFPVVVLIEQKA